MSDVHNDATERRVEAIARGISGRVADQYQLSSTGREQMIESLLKSSARKHAAEMVEDDPLTAEHAGTAVLLAEAGNFIYELDIIASSSGEDYNISRFAKRVRDLLSRIEGAAK